jgi:hypothetical protein
MAAKFKVTAAKLKCINKWNHKKIDRKALPDFWREVGSGKRRGVYVFAVRASKGWKPLYVGRTKKQNFQKRIGQHADEHGRFNRILKNVNRGSPWLFLIGRVGKGNKSNSAIDELEIDFINMAFERNEKLDNDRGLSDPKYLVQGFDGRRGKPSKAVQNLKTVIGY